MNDNTGKPSSCLAITEKKTLKPGGCIGIFFQVFDWNKRLAKKKLFSKKFLLPARTKQAVKKIKGVEKMPTSKDKLIANENSGGFPSSKRNANLDPGEKHEMRAPGLIARLMGLEAIPAVNKTKSKKTSFAESCGVGVDNFVGKHSNLDRKDVHMEVVIAKQESRPLKLQKTEVSERRAVSRFHTEALQIKSVLSQARKHHHHHPKLVSPLKSSKMSSAKSSNRSSRLIGAATKMLEPGLQATRRAKSTLTYSRSMLSPKDRVGATLTDAHSLDLVDRCAYNSSAAKPLIRQASCETCGNRVDIMDSMSNVQQGVHAPAASNVANTSSLVSDLKKYRACNLSYEKGRGGFQRNLYQVISPSAPETRRDNVQPHIESISREFPLRHEVFTHWNVSSQLNSPQKEESSIDIKRKNVPQDRMSFGGDAITHKSRLSNEPSKRAASASNSTARKAKDFAAQNRNLSQSRGRILPTKVDCLKLEPERKPSKGYDDSLPHSRPSVRKRRTANACLEDERSATFSSNIVKNGQIRCNALGGSRRLLSSPYSKHVDRRSKPDSHEGVDTARKANDVISFSFDSPIKEKTCLTRIEERSRCHEVNAYIQNTLPLKRDDLSSFLEQTFKELNAQEDEESAGALPKKSKAMILQDLISAIMDGRPVLRNGRMVNEEMGFYNDAKRERPLGVSPGGSHLSPGSVLEASFSSSSLDESTGNILHHDSMEYYNDQFQFWGTDAGVLESVTSFNKGRMMCLEALTNFANNIPKMLDCANISAPRMTTGNLAHVKNVIINTELLFRNATVDGAQNPFVTHLLIDELQNIASLICKYFNGCWDADEEGSKLRGFLFDSLIEYLDSNYCQYHNYGFKTWTKQILWMKAEMLLAEVELEINKWASLTGMITDELIEWDMSHTLGKWTLFEAEAFEIGADMGHDIIQILIEEIVADLAEYV